MSIFNYLFIGVSFMFLVEFVLSSKSSKKYSKIYPNLKAKFGFWERAIGIVFWPICLGIFIYHFLKQIFK